MALFFEIEGTGSPSVAGSLHKSQNSLGTGEKSDLQDSKLKIPRFYCSLLSHLV